MASKEEYTFGQLMGIITDIQEKISNFYEKAANKMEKTSLKELFLSFSKKTLHQKDMLTEKRRRTVTEMTLEPLTGLRLNEKLTQIDNIIKDEQLVFGKIIELEEILSELYRDVSKKIAYISADVSYLLDNFSREHRKRKRKLESLR